MKIKNKTPLHSIAWNNSKEIGELLILKGANIDATDVKKSQYYIIIFN